MKSFVQTVLVIVAAIIVFLWYNSTKTPDVRIVPPTSQPYVATVVQPVVIQPTTEIQVTVDAFYAVQTPTAESRGGWEAPTSGAEIGDHNPGRTDKRQGITP